jgi:hypothetical protein
MIYTERQYIDKYLRHKRFKDKKIQGINKYKKILNICLFLYIGTIIFDVNLLRIFIDSKFSVCFISSRFFKFGQLNECFI